MGKAIRTGDWKMSALPGKDWELFRITEDHTETKDLSQQFPDKVLELDNSWKKWAAKLNIK